MLKRACNEEQISERKNEIISACSKMFDEFDYQDITMKSISDNISIARSSLYCYYQSKEEIMLDVLKNEYLAWLNELINYFNNKHIDKIDMAKGITNIYINHTRLLKIVSIHLVDIEVHCSLEKLVEFKSCFVDLFPLLLKALKKQFSATSDLDINNFYNALLMLTHGLYPMSNPNKKQLEAMNIVGMKTNPNIKNYCYNYILFLLNNMK